MRLLHPEVATRSCADCKKWEYYTDGEKAGQRVKRKNRDEYMERRSPLPCDTPTIGCPKGHHTDPIELTEENVLAWYHYKQCSAVGFRDVERDDPIVRMNAAILKMVESGLRERRDADRLDRFARLMIATHY